MKQKQMVSIAEFAKMCGKPKAEVYKILEKEDFRKYAVVENGLKKVDTSLLDVLQGKIPEAQDKKEEFAEVPHHSTDEARDKETITALSARIEELEEELKVKDNTIMELSLKLAEMAQKTQDITEKALNAVNQQQILTALTAKKLPWYRRLLGGKSNTNER